METKSIFRSVAWYHLKRGVVLFFSSTGAGVIERAFDPDNEDVDCDHYEYQQMMDDADEQCHKGIGIENCSHCIFNKALRVL